jgi:hypothetical protein
VTAAEAIPRAARTAEEMCTVLPDIGIMLEKAYLPENAANPDEPLPSARDEGPGEGSGEDSLPDDGGDAGGGR